MGKLTRFYTLQTPVQTTASVMDSTPVQLFSDKKVSRSSCPQEVQNDVYLAHYGKRVF